jgi:hypothetical protein
MNIFEIAVLRVLIKRQQPMKLSILVGGFPDDSEDNVLSAISSLKLRGYLVFDDYQPNGYISINRERRKEILQIVDSDIHVDKFQSLPDKEKKAGIPIPVKKSPLQVAARHLMSSSVRTIAVSSLLIVGLVSAIGISLPTATSPDSQFVAYPGYMAHKKWSIAHADDDHEGHKISNTPPYLPPPIPASFLAIKDCNQKPLQGQQQT